MSSANEEYQGSAPLNISRRSFMLRASVLATSAALLTLSPTGRVLASWAVGPGEMPEAVGRMLLQDNCLAFNGERRDPVTGLYHLGQGYRAYNPRMMRFHAADSLSPFGAGGTNPYAYCLGDPINAIDPTGHLSWQAGLGIALGILGIIISIATLGVGIQAGIALNLAGGLLVAGSVLGVASGAFGIASSALESSNPQLSADLGWASLGLGAASLIAGISGAIVSAARATSNPGVVMLGRVIDVKNNQGITFFSDLYKGGTRLNIRAHGDWLPLFGKTSRMVGDQGKLFKVGQVYNLLTKEFGTLEQFNSIRTISCYSANGGATSFGQRLSNLTSLPVKSFVGSVADRGTAPLFGRQYVLVKNGSNYQPRVFSPIKP